MLVNARFNSVILRTRRNVLTILCENESTATSLKLFCDQRTAKKAGSVRLTHIGGFLAFDENELAGVVPPRRVHGEDRLVVGQDSALDAWSRPDHPATDDLVVWCAAAASDARCLGTQRVPSRVLCPTCLGQRLYAPRNNIITFSLA